MLENTTHLTNAEKLILDFAASSYKFYNVSRNQFVVDISNPIVISWLIAFGFKIQSHDDAYTLTKNLLSICDVNDPYDHISAVFMRDLIVVIVVFDVNRFSGLNDYFNSLDIKF